MKKFLSLTLSVLLVLASLGICAFADEAPTSVDVYVTITNKGTFEMAHEKITVTDTDSDGALTIADALYLAHEAKYDGGAEAGWSTYTSDYGLSIGKLWGDTSGNYGYYVNNVSAWSPVDPVESGDSINAFVYAGTYPNLESYSYFDKESASATVGDTLTLTLTYMSGYDETWTPQFALLSGATVTLNGEATSYKTDADGKVSVKLEKSGEILISALCEATPIVPPVCVANVAGGAITEETNAPEATDTKSQDTAGTDTVADTEADDSGCTGVVAYTGFAVLAITGISALTFKKRKNEK